MTDEEQCLLDLGARIALLRRRRGLTQQQLADRVGMARTTITQLEGGRQNMTLLNLRAVVKALDHELWIIVD